MLTDSAQTLIDAMAHADAPIHTVANAKIRRARGRLRRALETQKKIEAWTQSHSQQSLQPSPQEPSLSSADS